MDSDACIHCAVFRDSVYADVRQGAEAWGSIPDGAITALIYFVTGQFTVIILVTFIIACGLGELVRSVSHYSSFRGNTVSFFCFSMGMVGSPLPIWLMRESFLAQISEQGMPADYVQTLEALSSSAMLIVMLVAPLVGVAIGAVIVKGMFKKHFEKAGVV